MDKQSKAPGVYRVILCVLTLALTTAGDLTAKRSASSMMTQWQTDFCVDYVKVYQNENDLSAVQPDSDFTGSFDLDEKRYAKSALQQQGAFYCE